MAKAIDESKLADAKSLDIAKPPVKEIGHLEYPKMIYKHPTDKTKEHATKIVHSKKEQDEHTKSGWVEKPHIPEAPKVAEEE